MVTEKWWTLADLRDPEDFERREPLKLEAGVHKIFCENDGVMRQVPDFDNPDVKIDKLLVDVLFNQGQCVWFITPGQTTSSLFGQMTAVAKRYNGIAGKTLTVIVAGKGLAKRYQITHVDNVLIV